MDEPVARTFRIGPCVGRGGFGEVYRATMRTSGGLETEVALKVLRPDPMRRSDAPRRFRDEGRMLSRLQHPAVVRALDWADLGGGHHALVTEFVDGADLQACAAAGIPLRPLLEVVGAVASALDAAYQATGPDGAPLRVVHRDVKPTNVRVGRHGQVRLLDFGIASFGSDEREARTASDLVVGSMPYMAPERFAERDNSTAADIYGLGCCLFEGLAREPFHVDARLRELSSMALDARRSDEHRARRLAALDGVPPEVLALLARCLAYDPVLRPTSAELAATCEALAEASAGPSLRRWSAEPLPESPAFDSTWTGRLVTEGAPEAEGTPRASANDERGWSEEPSATDEFPDVARPTLDLELRPATSAEGLLVAAAPVRVVHAPPSPPPAPGRGARAALAAVGGLGCAMLVAAGVGAVAVALVAALDATW